jgi:hypothetical protein
VSYSLRKDRECYQRPSGEGFERVGMIDMRRGVVVPKELLHEAELAEARGRTVDPLARSHQ